MDTRLEGLVALRAFGRSASARAALEDALDCNARAWFWWLLSQRYLGFDPPRPPTRFGRDGRVKKKKNDP